MILLMSKRRISVGSFFSRNVVFHVLFLSIIALYIVVPIRNQLRISPPNTYYPLIHGLTQDYYYDLSVIRQGRTQFFEIDQYTTEETSSSTIHAYFLVLGRIAQLTGITNVQVY